MATLLNVLWARDQGYRGTDIHIVRPATGEITSLPLLPYVRLQFDTGGAVPVPSGTTVTFGLNIPRPAGGVSYFDRFGFEVQSQGQVRVKAVSPPVVVRNFLITATVAGTAPDPPKTAIIRVHIHDDFAVPDPGDDIVHLSPAPLHLRIGASAAFAVFAEFKDGAVGDITYDPGLTWEVASGPLTVAGGPSVPAGFRGVGFIKTNSATAGQTGTVRAKLPATLRSRTRDGTVNVLRAWNDLQPTTDVPKPYKATRIDGPGTHIRGEPDVRNVLILPEGFPKSEKDLFTHLADAFSKELSSSSVFSPYNHLNERINYYRLWVDPQNDFTDEGITDLLYFYAHNDENGNRVGSEVPQPEKPASDTAPVQDIGQLIYRVGIPVTADTLKAVVADQVADWNTIYGAGYVSFDPGVDAQAIYDQWQQFQGSGQTLNIDTMFGIVNCDDPPQVNLPTRSNALGFHPLRGVRSELDVFLAKIEASAEVHPKGVPPAIINIGNDLWVSATSNSVDLVVFLCLGARTNGTKFPSDNNKIQVAVSLTDREDPSLGINVFFPRFNAVEVDQPKLQRRGSNYRIPKSLTATLAHELAHTLLCGDEYSSQAQFIPESERANIDKRWNLQFADELIGADPVKIRDEMIRWRWPRVVNGGFMAMRLKAKDDDPVDPRNKDIQPGEFKVEMVPGYGEKFHVNDRVRYRRRELLSQLPDPLNSSVQRMQFEPPPDLFKIARKAADDPDVMFLTLVPDPNAPPFQNVSAAGNILYTPVLDANNKDLLIIDPKILGRMRLFGPVSRLSATCDRGLVSNGDPQYPVNVPFLAGTNNSGVLGLYDGGKDYKCGVYHASGACMMRRVSYPVNEDDPKKGRAVTRFCHVCRYLIVDQMDPRRHKNIEKERFKPKFKAT